MKRFPSLSPTLSRTRLWLTVLALLTFTIQTYIAQTHIHNPSTAAGKQVPGKLDDQANCAVCQAALHGGHYLTPQAGGFMPLVLTGIGISLATRVAIFVQSVSHDWTSRGPPRT